MDGAACVAVCLWSQSLLWALEDVPLSVSGQLTSGVALLHLVSHVLYDPVLGGQLGSVVLTSLMYLGFGAAGWVGIWWGW